MLKPLKLMEMPNLGRTLKKIGSATSDYIYRLNNANDIDNLKARYEKYLEMEKKKEEQRKRLRKITQEPTTFSHYSRSINYSKKIKSLDLDDNKKEKKNVKKHKKNNLPVLKNNTVNNTVENENEIENEKELILNLTNTKNLESSRNDKKKDIYEYEYEEEYKRKKNKKDIYSSMKEDNKNMRILMFKTGKYKNDISDLCNQINNTCLNFNTKIHGRPKYKFVTEREIQDSLTKKDLDVNEKRKPKVNAFKNMQLFREVKALTSLSYGLAVDGNKVIKDYLNNKKKKSKYNKYIIDESFAIKMNNNRKNLFHTARDILRSSIYENDKCLKNIDKYTREVEEDLN